MAIGNEGSNIKALWSWLFSFETGGCNCNCVCCDYGDPEPKHLNECYEYECTSETPTNYIAFEPDVGIEVYREWYLLLKPNELCNRWYRYNYKKYFRVVGMFNSPSNI